MRSWEGPDKICMNVGKWLVDTRIWRDKLFNLTSMARAWPMATSRCMPCQTNWLPTRHRNVLAVGVEGHESQTPGSKCPEEQPFEGPQQKCHKGEKDQWAWDEGHTKQNQWGQSYKQESQERLGNLAKSSKLMLKVTEEIGKCDSMLVTTLQQPGR